MPFGTYDTPKPPTIPTFLQYVKSCGKGVEGKTKFAIDIVWLPGKFDNVTLQCHAFRYLCDPSHPLYTETQEYLKSVVLKNVYPQLEIIIDSVEEKRITVSESHRKRGEWEELGDNAYKFKPN